MVEMMATSRHGGDDDDDEALTSHLKSKVSSEVMFHHEHPASHKPAAVAAAADESREAYCRPGIRGLFDSQFVALCAAFSALGGLLFGYDQGVVSVILVEDQFLARFGRIADGVSGAGFWKGLLTAMIELGALLGALNQGWIADRYSRKYSIVIAVCIFTVGSALQTGAVDYSMLVVARFVGGVGIGMLSMVAPLYIGEISPPEIRGTLLVLEEWSIVAGIVVAFWITYATRYIASEWAWRLPFLLQMLPGFVLAGGILFLPFSPRWLASRGRDGESLQALGRLRGLPPTDARVQLEWFDIRAEVALHQELTVERHPHLQDGSTVSRVRLELASWTDCFTKAWRRTHVGMMLAFFQQFVGINALIYYSPTLFKTMGLDYSMQLIISLWTMDRFGRRPLLLVGALAMFLAHLIIAVLVARFSADWPAHRPAGWASIFPSSLRAKGVGLSTASNWLNNFVIGLVTPPLVQHTGYGAYVFFAVFCLLGFVWVFVFVPETRGKTLEQMDRVFGDVSSEAEEARRARIERDLAAHGDLPASV
ncbi:putative MFS monosaccharide transporter [Teratosphaeria destructans]|uniref:MFS monosaccharide transporter n=1 Tax=Teratosphaeria destructans TaxID=418781 RepID=A0A9W7SLP0_9PEZI|nr:putative MFS monosaccharide transporter [Teratosphaeria destructans]